MAPASAALAAACEADIDADPRNAVLHWISIFGNSLTWNDLPWLRSLTSLPLILKGICHPEDARRAIDYGVDGIYCSNHGGRQAHGGLPAIDCLPGVVAASGDLPVLFDSGIRSGADIIKALALGASAVGIEAVVLTPRLGDFNEDLRLLGFDALAAHLRLQVASEDVARFMSLAT